MRIGFDVSQTGDRKAGCGYVADGLVTHLVDLAAAEDELILYPTFGDGVWDGNWPRSTRHFPQRSNVRRGLGHRTRPALDAFWAAPHTDLDVLLGMPDVVHSNNFFAPCGLRSARLVYTLHDLAFLEHPEWSTEANRLTCFSGVFRASLLADLFVAVSAYTRQSFLAAFPHVSPESVHVVHPGSRYEGPSGVPRPKELDFLKPRAFWLSVGTLEPRKNQIGLLRAYATLKAQTGETRPLVLAGSRGWLMDGFDGALDDLGIRDDVVLLGYVSDGALRWLYENCLAFCYVSFFEGFGLPVAEAMSLGAPVVTSNVTSLPELVGDAGLLVDPHEPGAIAAALGRLAQDEEQRDNFSQASLIRANQFTWTHAAKRVRELYDLACERPARRQRASAT